MLRNLGTTLGAAALLAAPSAFAQRVTGNLVGTVRNESGAVLPRVTVGLTGEKIVDTQANQVSTNYDEDWVHNAPIARFSMFDLIAAAPGVSQGTGGTISMVFG